MDNSERRQLNRGLGDTFNRSFEFAVVALLFLGLGWLIDSWLGTDPVFMVILVVVGLVGQGARLWYKYDAEMKVHEADLAARRSGQPKAATAVAPADHEASR